MDVGRQVRDLSESIEFNCARTWGFVSSCGEMKEAVETMIAAGQA